MLRVKVKVMEVVDRHAAVNGEKAWRKNSLIVEGSLRNIQIKIELLCFACETARTRDRRCQRKSFARTLRQLEEERVSFFSSQALFINIKAAMGEKIVWLKGQEWEKIKLCALGPWKKNERIKNQFLRINFLVTGTFGASRESLQLKAAKHAIRSRYCNAENNEPIHGGESATQQRVSSGPAETWNFEKYILEGNEQ